MAEPDSGVQLVLPEHLRPTFFSITNFEKVYFWHSFRSLI
jgi:hypothetical protein